MMELELVLRRCYLINELSEEEHVGSSKMICVIVTRFPAGFMAYISSKILFSAKM